MGHFVYGPEFVRKTLIDKLHNSEVILPNADGVPEPVTMKELGISYPVLISPRKVQYVDVEDPNMAPEEGAMGAGEMPRAPAAPVGAPRGAGGGNAVPLGRFGFVVHFCWQPKSPTQRKEDKEKEAEQAAGENLPLAKE